MYNSLNIRFLYNLLLFLRDAQRHKDCILESSFIDEKYPKWGDEIIEYLRKRDAAYIILPTQVNVAKEKIPSMKSNVLWILIMEVLGILVIAATVVAACVNIFKS